MTTRARLSSAGLIVAKPGQDVDSELERDLLFSPNSVVLRVAESGSLSFGTQDPPGTIGDINKNRYWRNTLAFAGTYSRPPVVYVNLSYVEGGVTYTIRGTTAFFESAVVGGISQSYLEPWMYIIVSTTQMDVAFHNDLTSFSPLWHYQVMEALIP